MKSFRVRDLVLKKVIVTEKNELQFACLKWEGSYTVFEVIGLETYRLKGKDSESLTPPWNGMYLRKYYEIKTL